MNMLISLIMVITSQCLHISKYQVVTLNMYHILFVNYISKFGGETNFKNHFKIVQKVCLGEACVGRE